MLAIHFLRLKNLLQVRLDALENQFREKVEGGNMLEER
jgi:hypothetical protein